MNMYLAACLCTLSSFCHGRQYIPFELPTPAGFDSHVTPLRIGQGGQVVGHVTGVDGAVHAFAWLARAEHALDAGMHVVGTCNSTIEIRAGIDFWAASYFPEPNVSHRRAYAWTPQTRSVVIDALSPRMRNAAHGISTNGIVAGWSETEGHDEHGAPVVMGFAWDPRHGVRPVVPLDGFRHGMCEWVNRAGVAVGMAFDLDRFETDLLIDQLDERLTIWAHRSRSAAFITRVGSPDEPAVDFITARSLDDMIVSDRKWRVESVAFIDDRGVVACNGVDRSGFLAGLLLVPTSADSDSNGVITSQEFAIFTNEDSNETFDKTSNVVPRHCELDGLLFSIGHWDVDRACMPCARWNAHYPGEWSWTCNGACYGCDGLNPDYRDAPNGAPGFNGQSVHNPYFPNGGPGGNGATGGDGGAGGDGGIGGDGGRGGRGGDAPTGSNLNGGAGGRGGRADARGRHGGAGGTGGDGDGTGDGGQGGSGGDAHACRAPGIGGNGGRGGTGGSHGYGGKGGNGGDAAIAGRGGDGGKGGEHGHGGSGGNGGHGTYIDQGRGNGVDGGNGGDAGAKGWSGGPGGSGGDGDQARSSPKPGKPGAGGKGGNGMRKGRDGEKGKPRRY
jgi:hypothetical protein